MLYDVVEPLEWRKVGRAPHRLVSLPWSDETGLCHVELPIYHHQGASGPRVLVVGGTHGDEFEGQWAASALISRIEHLNVSGSITVLPRHNSPACRAGTRCSPRDGVDLNRAYTGSARPGPSGAIAQFVTSSLLPEVDWLIDLHSGGATHEFLLSSNLQAEPGSTEDREMRPALVAFGAPYAIIFNDTGTDTMPHRGTLEGLARSKGIKCVSSELGGGARLSSASRHAAEHGLLNLLNHIGAVRIAVEENPSPPTRFLRLDHDEHYCRAPCDGLVVLEATLGQHVERGAVLAHIADEDPFKPTLLPIRARRAGIVAAVPTRARFSAGEMVIAIAEDA